MKVAHSEDITQLVVHVEQPDQLSDHHIRYLEERAVHAAWAAHAGLRSVDADEGARLLGFARPLPASALAIPYPNAPGYYRMRLDEGLSRFLVPAGVEIPIYIPPDCEREGDAILFVVEGPTKALALQDQGYNAIGLGGVDTTLTKHHRLNGSWLALAILGRFIVVLFDAGRAWNPAVARAEARLVLALETAGGKVLVARLPRREDGGDQGPDDYLAAHGRDALQKVIDGAVPGDPVERVRRIADLPEQPERRAGAVALLAEVPFLIAVAERGAAVRAAVCDLLRRCGLTKPEFLGALKEATQRLKVAQAKDGNNSRQSTYVIHDGRFWLGPPEAGRWISNFVATIERDVVVDDGVEAKHHFMVSGVLASGQVLPSRRVSLSDLKTDLWPRESWGAGAIVSALPRAAAHLLAAMQEHSNPTKVCSYAHTGWREQVEGEMVFLHAAGAVGGNDLRVSVGDSLSRYRLPEIAEDVPGAVSLSLKFLELADPRIVFPLFCAVYRAPLQHAFYCDCTVWMYGRTGGLKTSLAAAANNHFGEFDPVHMPASWSSTANHLEWMLFAAKDVLVVIDDFAPAQADSADVMRRTAQQVLRAIGNAQGRGRLGRDLVARPDRPPRALVIGTGEELPSGESINARLFPVVVSQGDVRRDRLSKLQCERGRLRHAMVGYLMWLKSQMRDLPSRMGDRFAELRDSLGSLGHLRSSASIAHLLLGAEYFARFAEDVAVFDSTDAQYFVGRARDALLENAERQQRDSVQLQPTRRFLAVLGELLARGKVGLASMLVPEELKMEKIGWQDADFVYLLPEAAYAAVATETKAANDPFPVGSKTLWRLMEEEGFSTGDGDHNNGKKTVPGGGRPRLVKLRRSLLVDADVIDARLDEVLGLDPERGDEGDEPPDVSSASEDGR